MPASRKAVVTAITADLLIAASKFTAFLFTHSAAMLSESIHSMVDAGNSSLLLLGIELSGKPADEGHPFGYGKELYFWTLLVALFIFLIGGGLSLAEGIHSVLHPHKLGHYLWSYATLAVAACFEGYSLHIGRREFRAAEGVAPGWRAIHASKDPATFTVIFEDTAALFGLLAAFVGTLLDQVFDWPLADGIASVVIGSTLMAVAVLLIVESKALLVGEGADVGTLRTIRRLAEAEPGVDRAGYPLTMYFGPENILLTMNVRFNERLSRDGIEQTVDKIEARIRKQYPHVRHIYLEAESIRSGAGEPALPGGFDPGKE